MSRLKQSKGREYYQYLEKMCQPTAGCTLTVIIVVLVENTVNMTSPGVDGGMCCARDATIAS